jgi:hypothetical protein
VTFPAPLDRALLERSIGVDRRDRGRVAGLIEVGAGETTWRFVPQAPWAAGAHQLAVQTVLEDPAGNKIGRAFEVLPSDPSANAPDAGTTLVTFTIR